MWKNPFPKDGAYAYAEGRTQESTFEAGQPEVNFVLLKPAVLPVDCEVTDITVRTESEKVRPAFRFVVRGKGRAFRVKQFYYDWSYPVVLADTNLVAQGRAFAAHEVAGFVGEDYKGHAAACYARWYTQVELSVTEGTFEEDELHAFLAGLTPVNEDAVDQIGALPFAMTSHTARFHQPQPSWGMDEVIRVDWWPAGSFTTQVEEPLLLPPTSFGNYAGDSIGYKKHAEGEEYQLLLRSTRNLTDTIWVWIAPERLSEAVPPRYGPRQTWDVEEVTFTTRSGHEVSAWLGVQQSAYGGWRIHWKHERKSYHVYVRPSVFFKKEELLAFVQQFA